MDRIAALGPRQGWCAYLFVLLKRPELVAVADYRLGQVLRRGGPAGKAVAVVLHTLARVWSSTDIHPSAEIGGGLLIDHGYVVVGPRSILGQRCRLYQGVTVGQNRGLEPTIGDDVVLSPGAKILGDVRIGDGALVGANAVVLDDIPSGATAVGVPARVIGC